MTAEKEYAHKLVDRLAPSQIQEAVTQLESLLDPVALVIARAPIDDEPVSEEE